MLRAFLFLTHWWKHFCRTEHHTLLHWSRVNCKLAPRGMKYFAKMETWYEKMRLEKTGLNSFFWKSFKMEVFVPNSFSPWSIRIVWNPIIQLRAHVRYELAANKNHLKLKLNKKNYWSREHRKSLSSVILDHITDRCNTLTAIKFRTLW